MEGTWLVKIESRVTGTVAPMWTSDTVTVKVDNTAPSVVLDITSGGGVCADFNSGVIISGPYSVSDDHFSSYQFQIVPTSGGAFTVNPSGGGSFSGGNPFTSAS